MEQVEINVGGVVHVTLRETVLSCGANMLSSLINFPSGGESSSNKFFIDRDPKYFRHIMNFMREKTIPDFKDEAKYLKLLHEVEYYQIAEMIEAIQQKLDEMKQKKAEQQYLQITEDGSGVLKIQGSQECFNLMQKKYPRNRVVKKMVCDSSDVISWVLDLRSNYSNTAFDLPVNVYRFLSLNGYQMVHRIPNTSSASSALVFCK